MGRTIVDSSANRGIGVLGKSRKQAKNILYSSYSTVQKLDEVAGGPSAFQALSSLKEIVKTPKDMTNRQPKTPYHRKNINAMSFIHAEI